MILDHLRQADRYAPVHPLFARAFAYLCETDLAALPAGRWELDGDRLVVISDHVQGRGRAGAVLEVHRKYIDLQYTVAGDEWMGWRALEDCTQPRGSFDEKRDILRFDDASDGTWFQVPPGHFVMFHPQDAHAPLGGAGPVHKIVIKVAVE